MERCISVRVRALQSLIFVVLTCVSLTSRADVAVVLVTDKDSPIQLISSLDIRKAYLGILVTVDGNTVRALRRRDDERLNQIFLQSVIAMSERSYERRLLSLMLKFGTPRPDVVGDSDELLESLARFPSSIAYMWKRDAEKDPRVRIIGVLWQET
jgi:hypothetical protein